jgi:hypothetical protein
MIEPRDRRLDEVDQPGLEREDGDDDLADVADGGVQDAADPVAEVGAQPRSRCPQRAAARIDSAATPKTTSGGAAVNDRRWRRS